MASGYDISASQSTSTSASTGAIKFGNVSIGSAANNSMVWLAGIAAAVLAVWLYLKK